MTKIEYIKGINWTIFTLVVLLAIISAWISLDDLYNPPVYIEDAQSRVGFRWGIPHMIISIFILIITVFLAIGWKRLFPFNIPIAIITVGFGYALFFLTFTIGWVGILGMLGFMIVFLIGVILIISYAVSNRMEHRKTIG